MLFNSLEFAAFFSIVTTAYFCLPQRSRWVLLLASSCYFYMAFVPIYILILAFTIVVDYAAGIAIEEAVGRRKNVFLVASLVANVGVLAVFKYYNFAADTVASLATAASLSASLPHLSLILPIGLSFHTFQAMSYTIEVYRGNQKAERHFGMYALYIMFYPQLVAGPIERPQNLLHQFRERHRFEYQRVTDGLKLMAWGLLKKAVIADRLAVGVDQVFGSPQDFHGISLIVGSILFSVQIFCDFSGYSDIAIGAAEVMGFRLMRNFDRPYLSTSIGEFWRRWHISLSSWFRDYLYSPLLGDRMTLARWYFTIAVVFLVSGLWHGANWTFLIWGAIHGLYVILGIATRRLRSSLVRFSGLSRVPALHRATQLVTTFSAVTFAFIFFRANSVGDALYIVTHLTSGLFGDLNQLFHGAFYETLRIDIGGRPEWAIALASILLLALVDLSQERYSIRDLIRTRPVYVRWSMYYAVGLALLFFGVFDKRQFIYFQF